MMEFSLSSAKKNKLPEGFRNIPFLLVLLPASAASIESESIRFTSVMLSALEDY